jgi:hypothetical protein
MYMLKGDSDVCPLGSSDSFCALFFFERKPWGNAPRQQEKYIKRGDKVTRKRDLHPAQPVIRQREGT